MTVYVFRVWLLPNPPQGFNPNNDVFRVIKIDSRHTLEDFRDVIFNTFCWRGTHQYEFVAYDSTDTTTRYIASSPDKRRGSSNVESDALSQRLNQIITQIVNRWFPHSQFGSQEIHEGVDTTISAVEPEGLQSLILQFETGGCWEHHIQFEEVQDGSLDGAPTLIDEQGRPPQQLFISENNQQSTFEEK